MKKDATALRAYFDRLPRKEASALASQLAEGCKVTRYTVFNWKYGVCRIPELAKDKITEILGQQIFDSLEFPQNDEARL